MWQEETLSLKQNIILVSLVSLIACFFLFLLIDSSWSKNSIAVPILNDPFYHAKRILDTTNDLFSFYQFDKQIHAPEGSWITWPWAF